MYSETKRLILREFRPTDAPDVYDYSKSEFVGPAAGWRPHKSIDESRWVVESYIRTGVTALQLKETGRVIGHISLRISEVARFMRCLKGIEMGYSLGVDYWGQGYMPEAVEAMLHHLFENEGYEIVWAGSFDNNVRSRRVQEKMGFRYSYTKKTDIRALKRTVDEDICFVTPEMFYEAIAKRKKEQ